MTKAITRDSTGEPGLFPRTRWSVVVAARLNSQESAAALEALCRDYWHPLYAYARSCGHSPHDAQDLTQEFFHRFLQKRWLDAADRTKGRLRTFLIVALKHFLSNERRRAAALKRGGDHTPVPLDTDFSESRVAAADGSQPPDDLYDQQWAITLLDRAIQRLEQEWTAAHAPGSFDILKHCLLAQRGGIDYARVAEQLGLGEGAARVAVHRLRKRFRELFRDEISQTLAEGADLEAEMRHLSAALARR